jgi:hypothetical protein
MAPIYVPISGSRLHSSIEKALIRSTEITRIQMAKEGRYMLQDIWLGRGNFKLNKVSSWLSVLQVHCGSLPHERDGMSAMAFSQPAT